MSVGRGEAAPVALADMALDEATKRFQAIWSSTFSMLQERNRLAHELEASAEASEHTFLRTFPYFGRDRTILKHMHMLLQALDTWKRRMSKEDAAGVPSVDQVESWTDTVSQLMELLAHTGHMMNDPSGAEILHELRSDHAHALDPLYSQTNAALEASEGETRHFSRLDMIQSMNDMPSTSALTSAEPFDTDEDRDTSALLSHNEAWRDQDRHLDHLSASISRQHSISVRMNEELELQSGIIGELDTDAESTGLRLGGAATRLERFRESIKEHGTCTTPFTRRTRETSMLTWDIHQAHCGRFSC